MTGRIHPRKLIVEGGTDKRVMPFLLEANGIAWNADGQPVVHIESYGGIEEMLKAGAIEGELAASGLEALGAVVDANGDAHRQWTRVRNRCREHLPRLPADIPEEGLQVATEAGPRFGVWIMPDNRSAGMLEDFSPSSFRTTRSACSLWPSNASRKQPSEAPRSNKRMQPKRAFTHGWRGRMNLASPCTRPSPTAS